MRNFQTAPTINRIIVVHIIKAVMKQACPRSEAKSDRFYKCTHAAGELSSIYLVNNFLIMVSGRGSMHITTYV